MRITKIENWMIRRDRCDGKRKTGCTCSNLAIYEIQRPNSAMPVDYLCPEHTGAAALEYLLNASVA